MARRRAAVRLAIPALIVVALAIIALWRLGPTSQAPAVGTSGSAAGRLGDAPLTTIADLLTRNAVGRDAVLEGVEVRERTSLRTFWVGDTDRERVFVVLDPNLKREGGARVATGERITLVGLVHPSPPANEAATRWGIDASTAQSVADRGVYLDVTEIRVAR